MWVIQEDLAPQRCPKNYSQEEDEDGEDKDDQDEGAGSTASNSAQIHPQRFEIPDVLSLELVIFHPRSARNGLFFLGWHRVSPPLRERADEIILSTHTFRVHGRP